MDVSFSEFYFIIAGAGSTGCVAANRLTENGCYRVLLLKAGPRNQNPWTHIPVGCAKTFYDNRPYRSPK